MKRSRFNEEQIIAILKEQESVLGTADLCRKHRISSATFYEWKAKYGGLEVLDPRRLKTLGARRPGSRSFWLRSCSTMPSSRMSQQKNGGARAKWDAVAHACWVHGVN